METGFSIIIPIYKVERYLEECIQSVLGQNYSNYEVLLVDDGSPDRCPEICDRYAKSSSKVQVIHKKNEGLSEARNTGMAYAKKEYILFLDSDDYWKSPELLAKLNKTIVRNAVDVIMFQRTVCYDNGRPEKVSKPYGSETASIPYPNQLLYALSRKDQLDASASLKAIRRCFLEDNALYFRKGIFCEDVEWFFRMAPLMKTVCIIDFPEYYNRIRMDSISHSISIKNINDLFFSIERYAEQFRLLEDDILRNALLNYLGYQYYIVLGLISGFLSGKERKTLLERCKKYQWLGEYAISRKVVLPTVLVKVFGIRTASFILGKYIVRRK